MWRRKTLHYFQSQLLVLREASLLRLASLSFKRPHFRRGLLGVTIGVLAFSSLAATGISALLVPPAPVAALATNKADCEAEGDVWVTVGGGDSGVASSFCSEGPSYHYQNMILSNRVLSYATLNALYDCLWGSPFGPIWERGYTSQMRETVRVNGDDKYVTNESDIRTGTWFKDGHWTAGSYLNDSTGKTPNYDGNTSCNAVVKLGISLWGFEDGIDMLCTLSNETRRGWNAEGGSCLQGADKYFSVTAPGRDLIIGNLLDRVYGGMAHSAVSSATVGTAGSYLLWRAAFEKSCSPRENLEAPADRRYEDVPLVNPDGTITYVTYEGVPRSTNRYIYTRSDTHRVQQNCGEIVGYMQGSAAAYVEYRTDHEDEEVEVDLADDFNGETPFQSSCAIDNIGWLICPVLDFGAGLTDSAFGFLADQFLSFRVDLLNTDPAATRNGSLIGTGAYTAWGIMRNFANIAFIIVFLITIFSQLTSLGVSNYGVKKLLPRLIIAAILVNVSFFICQIAIDLSNITGYSVRQLFDGIATQIIDPNNVANMGAGGGGNLAGIVGTVLAAGSLVWLNLGAVIVAVVAGLITLLTIFVILVLRIALIVLLTVVAPLAFVAYLLPNTEPLFKRWVKMFTGLLLVFPIVGLLFGASTLASAVISSAATKDDMLMQIIAYVILVVPLFAVIPLLKGSIDAVGNIGATINKLGGQLGGKAGAGAGKAFGESRLGQFQSYRKEQASRRRALSRSGIDPFRGGKKNPLNWGARANKGLNQASGRFGQNLAASGAKLSAGIEDERTKAAETLLRQQITRGGTTASAALQDAMSKGDSARARAAQNIMYSQGSSGLRDFRDTINRAQKPGAKPVNSGVVDALRQNMTDNHGQMLKSKAADQIMWAAQGGKLADHTSNPNTWRDLSQSDLATQTADTLKGARDYIDPATAAGLLDNDQLSGNLGISQKNILNEIAGRSGPTLDIPRGPAPGGGGGSGGGPAPSGGPTFGGGGSTPSGGGSGGSPAPTGGGSGAPSGGGPAPVNMGGGVQASAPSAPASPNISFEIPRDQRVGNFDAPISPADISTLTEPERFTSVNITPAAPSEPLPRISNADVPSAAPVPVASPAAPIARVSQADLPVHHSNTPVGEVTFIEPYIPNAADRAEQAAREQATSTGPILDRQGGGFVAPEVFAKQAYDDALKKIAPWQRPTAEHQTRKSAHQNATQKASQAQATRDQANQDNTKAMNERFGTRKDGDE